MRRLGWVPLLRQVLAGACPGACSAGWLRPPPPPAHAALGLLPPAALGLLPPAALAGLPAGVRAAHSRPPAARQDYVSLNNIADNPGATSQVKRVGRGIGSGRGKTSGRGHKGQKARSGRSPRLGFEGGQTPLRQLAPRRGFHNPHRVRWTPVNLGRLQEWVDAGRLDAAKVLTMKDFRDNGLVHKRIPHGVKLLAKGKETFSAALRLEVSQASAAARAAVEAAGGHVTTVYYNQLGLRALLKPEWFPRRGRLMPRAARPPPRLAGRFDAVGLGLKQVVPAAALAGAAA